MVDCDCGQILITWAIAEHHARIAQDFLGFSHHSTLYYPSEEVTADRSCVRRVKLPGLVELSYYERR
jgi:hypothetical protein